MRHPRIVLPVAGAGTAVLLTLASAPFDCWPLGWVAAGPWCWAVLHRSKAGRDPSYGRPFWIGMATGSLLLLLIAPWFAGFSPAGYPVAAAAWGLLFGVAGGLLVRWLPGLPPASAPPVLAAAWTVLEWLRAQGTLTFPWGTLSVSQARCLPALQMLDLTGSFGLSFLMALGAAAGATILASAGCPNREASRRAGAVWLLAALVLVTLGVGRGAWILAHPTPPAGTVQVGLVQMSESRRSTGAAVVCISPLEDYLRATRTALREGAELIVWPEAAATSDVVHEPAVRSSIRQVLHGSQASLLAGSFVEDPATGQTSNAAVLLSPTAEVLGQYAKVLIVPFGEYLPLRPLLSWTERLGMPDRDLLPGRDWKPLSWPGGKVGVSICYESAFGPVSRRMVDQGAGLLAVLTSDGWVGRTSAGYQHAAFAPLRAVECRRAVARAAATGVSQLIDPHGRVIGALPMFEKGVLLGRLPLRADRTFYSYVGDWPVGLSWGVLLAAAYRSRRKRISEPCFPAPQPA